MATCTRYTESGRVVGVAVMIVGTGFIALLTAAAAQRFLAADIREEVEEGAEAVEFSEAQILRELGQIREQLDRLHAAVERRTRDARRPPS
jgi:hypothetical protein